MLGLIQSVDQLVMACNVMVWSCDEERGWSCVVEVGWSCVEEGGWSYVVER